MVVYKSFNTLILGKLKVNSIKRGCLWLLDISAIKLGLVAVSTLVLAAVGVDDASAGMISPGAWLQYGALGVLALYIVLHWVERKDVRRRLEPALTELNGTLVGLTVLINERLPRRTEN